MSSINTVLKRVKHRALARFALTVDNPKTRKQNVLAMIGNVVSVLVIIVIQLFSYILISVKALAKRSMLDLM
jgi:hypothetical protein